MTGKVISVSLKSLLVIVFSFSVMVCEAEDGDLSRAEKLAAKLNDLKIERVEKETELKNLDSRQNDVVEKFNSAVKDYERRVLEWKELKRTHEADVQQYNNECLGRRLEPRAYARCREWQSRINDRKDTGNREQRSIIREEQELKSGQSQVLGLISNWEKQRKGLKANIGQITSRENTKRQELRDWCDKHPEECRCKHEGEPCSDTNVCCIHERLVCCVPYPNGTSGRCRKNGCD